MGRMIKCRVENVREMCRIQSEFRFSTAATGPTTNSRLVLVVGLNLPSKLTIFLFAQLILVFWRGELDSLIGEGEYLQTADE